MIKKTINDKLRKWHKILSKVLWAYKNFKNNATSLTPYQLTYRQDVVLPLELAMSSFTVAKQHTLQSKEYSQALFQELESADKDRLMVLENIQANKAKVSKVYNKRVKLKHFAEGDLVWKVILPNGTRIPKFGKWSPT